ncbi:Integrase (Phage-related protein) [Bacillus thuringiensis serovar kurstaki str. T03a001]|nr:Integrase (Phage-related protein) [Bacillus thuringiensis serovar kurstaki str. T03a001]
MEEKNLASFEKRATGWRYRVSYKDGDKYKTKTQGGFSTKKEAAIAASELEKKISRGHNLNAEDKLFSEYMREWFEVYKKGKHSLSHEKNLLQSVKLVEEHFIGVRMKDLNRVLYQNFLNELSKKRAKMTVKKKHNCVKACIKYAIEDGILHRDPTYKAIIHGENETKSEELKFINQEEMKNIVDELRANLTPQYISRYIILFAIATGARFGEIMGMTWDCIDLEERTITINKTWDYRDKNDFGNTKNYQSVRTITIDQETVSMLKDLQKHQKEHALKTGLRNTKNLCFINNQMEVITNNAVNKVLKKICARCNVKPITCHSLRHTHASILLYNGVNIKYISRRLGHKDIVITLQTYSHVLDEMEQKESRIVDQTMLNLFQSVI